MGIFDYPQSSSPQSNSQTFVIVQAQDVSGNWVGRSQASTSSPGSIRDLMESLKRQYPNSKVRAIDAKNGNIVDFLA